MAVSIGLKVDGGRKLRRELRQAGRNLNQLKVAHAKAAAFVLTAAKVLAPRRDGRLVNSGRSSGTQTAAIVRFGRKSVPYVGPIHWGWPRRNIAPNPFVSKAAQQTENAWMRVYENDVQQILDSVKGHQ